MAGSGMVTFQRMRIGDLRAAIAKNRQNDGHKRNHRKKNKHRAKRNRNNQHGRNRNGKSKNNRNRKNRNKKNRKKRQTILDYGEEACCCIHIIYHRFI